MITRKSYDVNTVRERTDLLALIGQHVALKKRGGRHTGLCPFHQEKTPSFSVDPAKGFWHCFGCGKGGDALDFVMQFEHLSFPEALERLAERAGIRPTVEVESPQRKEERDFLFEANAAAALAFQKALTGKAGGTARAYLEQRGITAEHAARFGLGYAPHTWDALVKHLRGRGFSFDVLAKAGLALPRTRGDGYIDRFRNRVMIPIHDRQGRVIAFGGRAMSSEDQPKYLNTAETPIFVKSRTLYALNWAAEHIAKRERAIVTEGYFDVVACHLAGFTEAVATLGTALGEEHAHILRRLAERVYLVYDGDSAGINAALRGQAIFRQAGVDVRIVILPDGHDPDSLLREGGAAAFERCLDDALSPVEFELQRLLADHPVRDADGRVRLFRAAAKVLHALPRLERAEYALWLIERGFGVRGDASELQQAILSEVAALERPRQGHQQAPVSKEAASPGNLQAAEVPLEREVLTAVIQHPEKTDWIFALVSADAFTHPRYRAVYGALLHLVEQGQAPDPHRVSSDDPSVTTTIAALAMREGLSSETLSFDNLVERLREAHEARQDQMPDNLDDPDALRAWTARLQQRSQRAKRRIFGEEE